MKATRALNQRALSSNNNDDEPDTDTLDPEEMNEGLLAIVDSVIGEEYLRRVSNQNDLTKVEYLQMQVNLNSQSVLGMEDYLPSLRSLVLDDSILTSVRDLGTGFNSLISLSLNSCALNDLDGINALANLKDLSACDNFITDAASLTMHENIETLKLSGNNIASISVADELNSCPKLKSLFLSRNPVEKSPKYRLVISSLITGLEKLDGVPVDRSAAAKVTNSMLLEAADALKLAEEEADDEERLMMEMQLDLEAEIAGADGQIIRASYPANGGDTGMIRGAIKDPSDGGPGSPRLGALPDTGSELTHGSTVVLAGSMAAAMRRRNRPGSSGNDTLGACGAPGGSLQAAETGSPRGIEQASSTLDVLDTALLYEKNKKCIDSGSSAMTQFIGEGDVTKALYPEHSDSPHSQQRSGFRKDVARGDIYASFEPEGSYSYDGGAVEELVLGKGSSNRSSRDGLTSDGAATRRPSSAAPVRGGQWVSSNGSGSVTSSSANTDATRRPGTSSPLGRPRATARNTPSAVFKIAADESDLVKFKSKINVRSMGTNNVTDKTPVWDVERTSTGHRAEKPVVAGAEEEEEEYHSHQDPATRSAHSLQLERARLGPKKSYIHQDMVIRSKEAHHDDEDIAVSARARHELVGAGRTKALAETDQETASVTGSKIGANVDLSGASCDATAASSFPSKGAASMAGMSLGFNLKESLAAIDQWVEEMDSDESTSRDGFDGEDDDSIEDLDLHNLSHKSLITSYADITPDKLRNVSTPRSEADPHITCTPGEVGGGPVSNATSVGNSNRPGSKGSSRSDSRGSSRADSFAPEGGTTRILSRDVIISMCHGGERLAERDSSSESIVGKITEDRRHLGLEKSTKGGDRHREREPSAGLPACSRESKEEGAPLKKQGEKQVSSSTGANMMVGGTDVPQDSSPPRVEEALDESSATQGPAMNMTDGELVSMLKMKPKAVPALRTRSAYCHFFKGISKKRMIRLLEKAYEETEDEEEKMAKVEKRVLVLDGFLV